MATIGTIAVGLTARTGRFKKDIKGAGGTVRRFSSSVAGAAGKVAKLGVVAAAAGAGALALLTKRSFANIDATAKLADSIGATTEGLAGLRHAAEITGAGSATMDKSLGKMAKTLGEAKQGLGTGKAALEQLGIPIDKIISKRPAEQFGMIADAINKVPNATERAALSTQLFGRSGVALVNTLALGSKGLAEMQTEADKLGLSFSRVDAAKVEAANDAWTRVQAVITGVGNAVAIQLAPFVETLADKFANAATSGGGMAKHVVGAFEWVTVAIAKVADYVDLVRAGFLTLASGFGAVASKVLNAASVIKGALLGLSAIVSEAFGGVLKSVATTIANIEMRIKMTFNNGQRLVGLMSDAENIKANNQARKDRTARAEEIATAGGAMQRNSADTKRAAEAAMKAGLTGAAGAAMGKQAEVNALKAVQAYRRFSEGKAQSQVAGWFDGVKSKSEEAAKAVAAKAADRAVVGGAAVAAADPKTKANIRGGFSASSVSNVRTIAVQEKQLDQLKKLNTNIKENTDAVKDGGGLS